MRVTALVLMMALFGPASSSYAVEPDELLGDPALEDRARAISRQLRCVVCQSESIDDSNAPLAKDMRLLVREQIVAGQSDAEIIAYLRERYGDYILLNPPVQKNTIILWIAPALIFLIAGAGAGFYLHSMRERDGSQS